jgi:hypothetical protein
MRVVAARAAHAEGGMDVLFREHRLIVATVAEIGLRCHKSLVPGVRLFMGRGFGEDSRMADTASDVCFQRPMEHLSFYELLVTSNAVCLLGGGSESQGKKKK